MSLAYGDFTDYEKKILLKVQKYLLKNDINITSIAIAENDELNLNWKIFRGNKTK